MEYTLFFINQNPDFDRKYAETRHKGGESEHNLLNLWEDEIEISGTPERFEIVESGELKLRVERGGKEHEISIPECTLFRFQYSDGTTTELGASAAIVKDIDTKRLPKETVIFVYLMSKTELFRPVAGIYLESEPEND